MRVKWRTGSLTEKIATMKVSKPIYFLMLLTLVVGLILANSTHIEFISGLIRSEADLELIETLASGGSVLLDGDVEEILDQVAGVTQRIRQYYEDGKIACSTLDLFALAEMGYVQILVVLIYVIGVAAALVPLFVECDWKARYLVAANIAPLASMAILALASVKMNKIVEAINSLLGSGAVEVVRTTELTALVIVSAFNLIFAACLMIGIVTSKNSEN